MAKASPSGLVRPSPFWFLLLDGGIVLMAALIFNDQAYQRAKERVTDRLPSRQTLMGLLVATAVIHLAEAIAAGRVARGRGLAPGPWRVQTFVVGFPSLIALRKTKAA